MMPALARRSLRNWVRQGVRGASAFAWTAGIYAALVAHEGLRGEDDGRTERYKRRWARGLMRLSGIRLHRQGVCPELTGPVLVVSNHRTVLDIPILMSELGGHFLSRGDVEDWPVLGPAAKRAGTLFVDRDDKHSGARAIRDIRTALKAGGRVAIFPEGSTFSGDEVRPFHRGAFVAARGLPVSLLPVGLAFPPGVEFGDESFVVHVRNLAARRRLAVGMAIGAPVPMGEPGAVALTLRDRVADLVLTARRLAQGAVEPT